MFDERSFDIRSYDSRSWALTVSDFVQTFVATACGGIAYAGSVGSLLVDTVKRKYGRVFAKADDMRVTVKTTDTVVRAKHGS